MEYVDVLIVEDVPADCAFLCDCLAKASENAATSDAGASSDQGATAAGNAPKAGYRVQVADRSSLALDLLAQQRFDCVLLDYWLQGEDGLDILATIVRRHPDCPVIMMTGQGSEQTAIDAMKLGAADYLTKGRLSPLELDTAVRNAIERLRMKQQLEENERLIQQQSSLEALGQLSAGIAHDFNNVATAIRMALDAARQDPVRDRTARMLDIAIKALDQVSAMSDRLLSFSGQQAGRVSTRSCQQVLGDLQMLVRETLTAEANVEFLADHPEACTHCDQNLLLNALLNLVLNARDAVATASGAGHIVVQCALQQRQGAASVVFLVQDDGIGMTAKAQARAVDPFYSTKRQMGGTGLGLAMAAEFASQSGGGLEITSQPGVGTTVCLWLPESAEPCGPDPEEETPVPTLSAKPLQILLVEDEIALRYMLSEELESAGHRVDAVAAGKDALVLAEAKTHDVLITDINLSGSMSGFDLAAQIRQSRPDMRIIGMSGYHDLSALTNRGAIPEILAKPFDIDALLHSLTSQQEAPTG